MGGSPHEALRNADRRDLRRFSSDLKYRFNNTDDITCFLHVVAMVLRSYGSLEALFMAHFRPGDVTTERAMTGFVRSILTIDTSAVYGADVRPPGFLQFFPSPENGSTCKRMSLFLRWVVRDRDIDLGIWKGIPKNGLVIPLDTHIARIALCIGLTNRRSMDWKMALDITESLRRLDPRDPLKYDFALCHQGIAGICRAAHCADCRLFG